MTEEERLNTLLQETREFPPPEDFKKQANFNDPDVYRRAEEDPEGYWAEQAKEISWFEPYNQVLDWQPPMQNGL